MKLSEAIAILDDFYAKSDDDLLAALAFIGSYKKHLTDEQRQQVYDACSRMTWADRFLVDMPSGPNNPGQLACELKAQIWRPGMSMVVFDLALNSYLKRRGVTIK